MKSKEEIEQLAEQYTQDGIYLSDSEKQQTEIAYMTGYTQCQEDVDWELLVKLSKRYTLEDLTDAFDAGINNDYGNGPSFDTWLNSLNKQD